MGYFKAQISKISSSHPFFINELYFWFSLVFLTGKTVTLILIASNIQSKARFPIEVFRSIPSEGWNEELQRFFYQIKSTSNALSALDFFFLTRKLLFSLLGALVTYELVLLQFKSEKIDWESLAKCNETFKH